MKTHYKGTAKDLDVIADSTCELSTSSERRTSSSDNLLHTNSIKEFFEQPIYLQFSSLSKSCSNFNFADVTEDNVGISRRTEKPQQSLQKLIPPVKFYGNIHAKVNTFSKTNTVEFNRPDEARKSANRRNAKPRRASYGGMPIRLNSLNVPTESVKKNEKHLNEENPESRIEIKPEMTYFCENFINSQRKPL